MRIKRSSHSVKVILRRRHRHRHRRHRHRHRRHRHRHCRHRSRHRRRRRQNRCVFPLPTFNCKLSLTWYARIVILPLL